MVRDVFTCAKTNDNLGLSRILSDGADVNARNVTGESPLHIACVSASYDAAVTLIASGADVHMKTRHFLDTPLHFAVQQGHVQMVQLLLDAGADPNAKNRDLETPIFTAIRWSQPGVIAVLAERGCSINALNGKGMTPLALAASLQSPGLVKHLLNCGVTREVSGVPPEEVKRLMDGPLVVRNDIEMLASPENPKAGEPKQKLRFAGDTSALFNMVGNNQIKELQESLDDGADVNACIEETGETLLHAAVSYGSTDCVSVLLDAGASVTAQTSLYMETPLHMAIQESFFDIFHSIMRADADVESQNCDGESPLFTAVKYNRVDMFRVLVRKGANVNAKNLGGLTPVHFAVMDGNSFLLECLLYHGADPTNGDLNPYIYAFKGGDYQVAGLLQIAAPSLAISTQLPPGVFRTIKDDDEQGLGRLIVKGFDVNSIDALEGAPLHCAVENRAMKCLALLIANSANVNIRSVQRMETPIEIAIRTGNKKAYTMLMEHDIDFALRNSEGENALFYAVRKGDEEAMEDAFRKGVSPNEMNENGRTPLYVAVSLKKKDIVERLLQNDAVPQKEVHPSFTLAEEMDNKEISALIKKLWKPGNVRRARTCARSQRRQRPTTVVEERKEPQENEHTPGMCYVCERNPPTQKLIPCGHVVACRGCIKNFIEQHVPCPECKFSFYATAAVDAETS